MNTNSALDNGHEPDRKSNKALQQELAKLRAEIAPPKQGAGMKLVSALRTGFGNIAQSLNDPSSKRRPRIARIMETKPDIVNMPHKMNANYMKDPHLRGQTIQGAFGRPRSSRLTPQDVYKNRTRTDPYRR